MVSDPLSHFVCRPDSYGQEELHAPSDLSLAQRRFILQAYHALAEMTFYELLNVHPLAERREIRQAYFALSKVFHPDSLFGRNLGAFQRKMEAVFIRLTQAYEVLGNPKRRQIYDACLAYVEDTTP